MEGPIRNILLYIDGTEQSFTAAQYAVCLSKATGARLTALYVINTHALQYLVKTKIFLPAEQEQYLRDLEADAGRYLNQARELARLKDLEIDTIRTSGTVHEEVCRVVAARRIDLLVVGALPGIHSRRDELYSESERAVRCVSCPVLVVKDPERVRRLFESLE